MGGGGGRGEGVKTTENKIHWPVGPTSALFLILIRMFENRQKHRSKYNLKHKYSVVLPSLGATRRPDKYWNQLGNRVGKGVQGTVHPPPPHPTGTTQ